MIGIFFAEGYEEIEALTVVDILRRGKVDIQMISITEDKVVKGSHGIPVEMDHTLSEVDLGGMDMMILPGGMPGTRNLEACDTLMQALDAQYKADKYIAAICAAPTVFGHRGYLQNRKACCYPGMEGDLTGAEVSFEKAVKDGHVITGRGMGCAIAFALLILETLQGKEAAERMAESIVYEA